MKFLLNKEDGKIKTKYTYGVALLQLPFFIIADAISFISNDVPRDGFWTYLVFPKSQISYAAKLISFC
jgi:hypothetical protein